MSTAMMLMTTSNSINVETCRLPLPQGPEPVEGQLEEGEGGSA